MGVGRIIGQIWQCVWPIQAEEPDTESVVSVTVSNQKREGIDVLFDEAKTMLDIQDGQIGALDSKANFGIGSSTLLVVVTGFLDFASQSRLDTFGRWVVTILVGLSLLLYLRTLCAAFQAYRPRSYLRTGRPSMLRDDLLDCKDFQVKEVLLNEMAKTFEHNEDLVRGKVSATKTMLRCIMYQGFFVSLLILVRTVLAWR